MSKNRAERLRRLEAKVQPPYEPREMSPAMDLWLVHQQHERDTLDYQASLHNPRLAPLPDPGPLILTPAQEAESKTGNLEFLAYLEEQKELARGDPATLEGIEHLMRMTQEEIDKNREDEA